MPSELLTITTNPLLQGLAGRLISDTEVHQDEVDLESTLVVLPTQRARRLFEHFLLDAAEQKGVLVIPPEITTPGRMVDFFVPPSGIPANPITLNLVDALVWATMPDDERQLVEGTSSTESSRESLVQRLGKLHHECRQSLIDFSSIRDQVPEGLSGGQERQVWDVLVAWEEARKLKLEELQIQCPSSEQAKALESGQIDTSGFGHLVVVDGENSPARATLLSLLDKAGVLVSRVVPQTNSPAVMDPVRGGNVMEWSDADLQLDDSNLHVADGPEDQARLAAGLIQKSNKRSTREITLVCPDPGMEAAVRSLLPSLGVPVRVASGGPLLDGGLGRLLNAVQRAVNGGWSEIEAALRTPGILEMLDLKNSALGAVDRARREHLGIHLHDERMKECNGVRSVAQAIEHFLDPLRNAVGHEALPEIARIAELGLNQSLPERTRDDLEESTLALRSTLDQFQTVPADLLTAYKGPEILKLVLCELEQMVLTPDAEDDSVEVVGWLEAAWDPAPLRIILGMNETLIPKPPTIEPLVPDGLRQQLGLDSQARRTARDAWLVHVAESSRSEDNQVEYILPRQNADGDRLLPSRLVLPMAESTLKRLPTLLSSKVDHGLRPIGPSSCRGHGAGSIDFPLLPNSVPAMRRVSVTDFRTWLDSPIRFVLKKLNLAQTVEPWRAELDAMRFGTLVHAAFESWGKEESTEGPTQDLKKIQNGFLKHLEICVTSQFGHHRPAALQLQIEIARQRMLGFADHQWRLVQEGWAVEHVELHFTDREVKGAIDPLVRAAAPGVIVTGKIDRVDRHLTGKRRAIDYKILNASDLSKKRSSPSHYQDKKKKWTDLQLPAYRTRLLDLELGEVEVALALLPHHVAKTEVDVATWNEDMFRSAESEMDQVLQRVASLSDIPLEGDELRNPGGFGSDRFDVLWGDGLRSSLEGDESNGEAD